ncbi:MAG TPA: DUF2867 domain-containing protein [Saprospiraceae bacterium]|nr:DUF2867 domain-containing protein [Saprospiraceae bacterium]
MKIQTSNLPITSLLQTTFKNWDYVDSFQGEFSDVENKIHVIDAAKAFFSSGPKWVGKLFDLRNKIVSVFGLKTAGDQKDRKSQLENFKWQIGEQLGLFKVYDANDHEIVMGEDDKHLNFRVSMFLNEKPSDPTKKQLTISTVVQFNNWFGKLYFLPVRPFHKIIVPVMLRGIIKQLEQK